MYLERSLLVVGSFLQRVELHMILFREFHTSWILS
jgi:hypothetical protein